MKPHYTDERNAQIVIALLKAHNIRKVIVSPGNTNVSFVSSIQTDPYFELYSAPDERSAGYIACGMAVESAEPVVLSCTGATASRNYYPALTEAYYRKIPLLAVTSSRKSDRIGHNFDQVTDRTVLANDVAKLSVQMPVVYDKESEWACTIAANKAMLELRHRGGGPVHINLETTYSTCSVKEIAPVRAIYRFTQQDELPPLKAERVAIMVGAHREWDAELTAAVDAFCTKYNAIVLCDHTSNYYGHYRVSPNLATHQKNYLSIVRKADLIIHIGDISSSEYGIKASATWRVNPDGEIRDTFWNLKNVFELEEQEFFERYASMEKEKTNTFFKECCSEDHELRMALSEIEIPFSNVWIASVTADKLPENSTLHLGIRNSLRSWNFFNIPDKIRGYANTGGFGIDGSLSALLGASLANKDKLFFCVLGDLSFFYDMNVLGNRHIGNNIRILLINNGTGMEMKFSTFFPSVIGAETDAYMSATGHYGNKSGLLVKHYAQDLGFEYYSASDKQEYLNLLDKFTCQQAADKPIVFECFTNDSDEDQAYNLLSEIKQDKAVKVKNALYDALGRKNVDTIKKIVKK